MPVSFGGDTKGRWSLLSGVNARGSKRRHHYQSALECVTVVDSTAHSKLPQKYVYVAENAALHWKRSRTMFSKPISSSPPVEGSVFRRIDALWKSGQEGWWSPRQLHIPMQTGGRHQIEAVFWPGFQKGRVPSEKGTFSAVNGPLKGHN